MLVPLLAVSGNLHLSPPRPSTKVQIDGRELLETATLDAASLIALSDDGRMVFDLQRHRRASLPGGGWGGKEVVLISKTSPQRFLTASQMSHLPVAGDIVGARPLASPRRDRLLVASGVFLGLLRYEARGPRPNPTLRMTADVVRCRAVAPETYEVQAYDLDRRRYLWFEARTKDDRLVVRRVPAPPGEGPLPPPPDGSKLDRSGWREKGVPWIGQDVDDEGRYRLYEWLPRLRRWRVMSPPSNDRTRLGDVVRPRLVYSGERLFATLGPGAGLSGTYEASKDRTSWQKLSERDLLVISANGRLCLTTDPKTGETWLERFPLEAE